MRGQARSREPKKKSLPGPFQSLCPLSPAKTRRTIAPFLHRLCTIFRPHFHAVPESRHFAWRTSSIGAISSAGSTFDVRPCLSAFSTGLLRCYAFGFMTTVTYRALSFAAICHFSPASCLFPAISAPEPFRTEPNQSEPVRTPKCP